jgi:hypothetical protein
MLAMVAQPQPTGDGALLFSLCSTGSFFKQPFRFVEYLFP